MVRYLLPFVTLAVAHRRSSGDRPVCAEAVSTFPYAFFFLIADLRDRLVWRLRARRGCLPDHRWSVFRLLAIPGFRLTSVDPSRVVLLIGVSALVSLVAQSQRKKQRQLRDANDDIWTSAFRMRTQELAQRWKPSKRRSHNANAPKRLSGTAKNAWIWRWTPQASDAGTAISITGQVDRSARHDQIFGYDTAGPAPTRDNAIRTRPPGRPSRESSRIPEGVGQRAACANLIAGSRQQDGSIRWVWGRGRVLPG